MSDRSGERGSSNETVPAPRLSRSLSDEDVAGLWNTFKSGKMAYCPRDGAGLALSVDAVTKSYRLVCTHCGVSSAWFETAPTGIHVRSAEDTIAPGTPDE